jgi:excisionase family DNA binding protein
VEHNTRNNEARDVLSPEELAEYLGCSRTHAFKLLAGQDPAIRSFKSGRLRRVLRVDVEIYVQRRLEEESQR